MSSLRKLFAGTHLENAATWMLEIEAMHVGGWELRLGPKVKAELKHSNPTGNNGKASARGQSPSVKPQYAVDRHVRISEPRLAPRAAGSVRHHHFEQRTILSSRKGEISVAQSRGSYIEGHEGPNGVISAEVRATSEASYMEGGNSTEAERVVYVTGSNGDSYAERMQFWHLANENAHFLGDHSVTVNAQGVEEAWDFASKDPSMPDPLRKAIGKAKVAQDLKATVLCNDAGVVKRWLKKNAESFPPELRANLILDMPGNGRVAQSLIGQFPYDMSLVGMRRCLDLLGEEFRNRSIPFEAVIHEPTAKNSKKNWHFHLLHYAGPAERLDDGRWSFEREWRRNKWRTNEWVPLKKLGRHDDLAAGDWIPKLKTRWSEIVNEQAITEGITTRFTNETNKARGIQKPQTRYSPGKQALRTQGYFTDTEVKDNVASWGEFERHKRQNLGNILSRIQSSYDRLFADPKLVKIRCEDKIAVNGQLANGTSALAEASELADAAAKAMMLGGMITSGAKDVVDHYSGVDATLAAKSATQSRTKRRAFAQRVCAAAQGHLVELKPTIDRLAHIQSVALAQFAKRCADAEIGLTALEDWLDAEPTQHKENKDRLDKHTAGPHPDGAYSEANKLLRARIEAMAHILSKRLKRTDQRQAHCLGEESGCDKSAGLETRAAQWAAHQQGRSSSL